MHLSETKSHGVKKRAFRLICLSFVGFILCLSLSYSDVMSQNPSGKNAACQVDGISFPYPKKFIITPLVQDENVLFLSHKKDKLALFVAAPAAPFDENKLLTGIVEGGVPKLFPKQPSGYRWKPLPRPKKASRYEERESSMLGFNQRQAILFLYRRLKVGGRDVLVGYLSEFGKGAEARESFEQGLGGDNMAACHYSVEIISSITGEKLEDVMSACELVVEMPAGTKP